MAISALDSAKGHKRDEISREYEKYIEGDFGSNALGSTNYYSSDHESQVNLIGAALAQVDLTYRCGPSKGGAKTFQLHTAAQIGTVFGDGVAYKHAGIIKYQGLLDDIDAATTVPDVDAIVW